MRIALVNETRPRRVGGIETYLDQLVPALVARGHDVAFLYEAAGGSSDQTIQIGSTVPQWSAGQQERTRALESLSSWKPDFIFMHSRIHDELRAGLLKIAPVIYFAHNFYSTCISGLKRHAFPQTRPCQKVFSSACLAHYFPRRCGGLNPLTMFRSYRSVSEWLSGLRDVAGIVVASSYMAAEYRRHGFEGRVHVIGLPVGQGAETPQRDLPRLQSEPLRLLFMGRIETYKGGMTLLGALPFVRARLQRRIELTFAGDGPERGRWEAHANSIVPGEPGIEVKFAGWLSGPDLSKLIEASDLLVLPSVWPEPFGLVGLEAGAYGLPTVAFDVGGISDWLAEGVNGHLAPGNPPTAQGFAQAIYRCVVDPAHFALLRDGARKSLERFTMARHLEKLENVVLALNASQKGTSA
jgi:glycosyltransferase involved in cell wall biosynthesis